MAVLRILHCADIHLDSPLRGLEADPDAPVERIRLATRDALSNMVELALAESVRLVLIAGDLYDGEWPDWRTGQFLQRQIERLTRAGIRVVAIRGNHDAESIITRRLRWPEGAHLLRADMAETVVFDELGIAVHGRSFATRDVLENLAATYPAPRPGFINIGLLHTAAEGRAGHSRYAPCDVEQLRHHGYEYWALGHVHVREVVSQAPWIVFPGNIQGRDIGETGDKGVTLITVNNGAITAVEHRVLDVVRWAKINVDLTGAEDEEAALVRVRGAFGAALEAAAGRLLAARVVLHGDCAAHAALSRSLSDTREKLKGEALACGGAESLWLEQVVLATRPALDFAALRGRTDQVGQLVGEIEGANAVELGDIMRDWAGGLLERAGLLRAALGPAHVAVQAAEGQISAELMERAKAMLLARLAA
jgi:DNA repair exonuclease SbcCD nuclease subunit